MGAPATIAVVDGVLEPETRLPAEEARRAAERGFCLMGAASVGALLAADPSISGGVAGVGRIFRLVARGRAEAADIALLYAAHDLRPLTVPAVDVLCWLEDAVAAGHLPPDAAEASLDAVRTLPIEERSPAAVRRVLHRHLGNSLSKAGDPSIPGAKARDARRLLRLMRRLLERGAST